MSIWLRLRYPRFCFASSDLLQQFHEMQQLVFKLRKETRELMAEKARLESELQRPAHLYDNRGNS